MNKRSKKKIAPIVVAVLVVLYIGPIVLMTAALAGVLGASDGAAAAPFLLLYALVGGAVIVGVLYAMGQRLREIDGGEEEDAKNTDSDGGMTRRQAKRRKNALFAAASATILRLVSALALLWLWAGLDPSGFLARLLLIFVVLDLGSIIPIWINLRVRLKEIQGGEEDAAAQY